jgi:hypothetical protein
MYDIITIDIDQWVHAGHNARRYAGRGDNGRFALTLMSACGTKQTCSMRWQMSAFGGKADSDQPLLTDPDL